MTNLTIHAESDSVEALNRIVENLKKEYEMVTVTGFPVWDKNLEKYIQTIRAEKQKPSN